MVIEYLKSEDSFVHIVNAQVQGAAMTAGILCVMPGAEIVTRIADDNHVFTIELPSSMLSRADLAKAFNVELDILTHEQV